MIIRKKRLTEAEAAYNRLYKLYEDTRTEALGAQSEMRDLKAAVRDMAQMTDFAWSQCRTCVKQHASMSGRYAFELAAIKLNHLAQMIALKDPEAW